MCHSLVKTANNITALTYRNWMAYIRADDTRYQNIIRSPLTRFLDEISSSGHYEGAHGLKNESNERRIACS